MPVEPATSPVPLKIAAAVVSLEGIVLLGLGGAELVALHSERLLMGISTALFFLAAGAGLLVAAWGLWRVRRFGRGPVLFAQLVALGLAWNMWPGSTRGISVALVVAAVIVLAGMLHPASVRALEDMEEPG